MQIVARSVMDGASRVKHMLGYVIPLAVLQPLSTLTVVNIADEFQICKSLMS
jgi:hypothetical protein